MGDRGPRLPELVLTCAERETLQGWARRPKTAQALALRARIVLACASGKSNMDVSRELRVSPPTVTKWRRRFVSDRLEGLSDEPRAGAPRTITDQQVEQVITKTLEESPPKGDTHWSTRSMAAAVGMSQTAISRIWRAFELKPHLIQTWKLSTDPEFVGKVRFPRDAGGLVIWRGLGLVGWSRCRVGYPAVDVAEQCRVGLGSGGEGRARPVHELDLDGRPQVFREGIERFPLGSVRFRRWCDRVRR